MKKHTRLPHLVLALLSTAIIGFTSCSTQPASVGPPAPFVRQDPGANATGFSGEVVTDSASVTATVVSVDPVRRLVVLNRADGRSATYKATREAPRFDEIKVGDRIKLSVAEELAVFMGTNGVPASVGPVDAAKLRVRLPGGTEAIATEVATLTFTGKIMALDYWNHTVTLQLAGGPTKTVRVSEYVNLADVHVGDSVSVFCTEAAALVIEKPLAR